MSPASKAPLQARHTASASTKLNEINVATVNVRYDGQASCPVPIPPTGHIPPGSRWRNWVELPWSERRTRLVDCLLSTGHLDIIAFQEVLHNQLLDLQTLLGESYSHVGVGRDDGKQAGEYSPIFWDNTVFDKVGWKTIWLSKTPDVPGSKDWDANLTRIATFLCLRHIASGDIVHVINTHYDDMGKKSRAESSYIIRQLAYEYFQAIEKEAGTDGASLVILLGDFNSTPNEAGYGNITSPLPLPSDKPSYVFIDTYTHLLIRSSDRLCPGQTAPYGPTGTYTGFVAPGSAKNEKIDFVFLATADKSDERIKDRLEGGEQGTDHPGGSTKGRGGWEAVRYMCLDNYVEGKDISDWQGRWSDHRAVKVGLKRFG